MTEQVPPIEAVEAQFIETLHQPARDIFIQCPTPTAPWLASDSRLEALKGSLLKNQTERILIIFDTPNPELSPLRGLLNLRRRLSSRLQLRCILTDCDPFTHLSLLVGQSLWRSNLISPLALLTDGNKTVLSQQQTNLHREQFWRIWDHQTWDNPNLREVAL